MNKEQADRDAVQNLKAWPGALEAQRAQIHDVVEALSAGRCEEAEHRLIGGAGPNALMTAAMERAGAQPPAGSEAVPLRTGMLNSEATRALQQRLLDALTLAAQVDGERGQADDGTGPLASVVGQLLLQVAAEIHAGDERDAATHASEIR